MKNLLNQSNLLVFLVLLSACSSGSAFRNSERNLASQSNSTFGVCRRTPQVVRELESEIGKSCNEMEDSDLASVKVLDLSSLKISSLHKDEFQGLTQLSWLYLSDNQLSALPENIFDNLKSLKVLTLGGNQLTHLSVNQLSELTELRELHVARNPLTDDFKDLLTSKLIKVKVYY